MSARLPGRVPWLLPAALAVGTAALVAAQLRPERVAAASQATFPLRVVPGKRYLVDAAGRPFLLNGDTAWSLLVQLDGDGVERYLEDRRRRGFNAILVNLLEHKFAAAPPRNAYGEAPFAAGDDFGSPNAGYFARAAAVVERARAKGMLVLLTPAYAGIDGGDEGWWAEMREAGADRLREYGRFLGETFRRFDNVLWVDGGDFDPPRGEQGLVEAVAEGIRSVDPALHTFHGARGTSAFAYWSPPPAWLGVNTIYTDETTVVARARQEHRRSTTPFFLIEARYEGHGADGQTVRRQAYQAVLAGAAGSFLGARPIWSFAPGWERALGSPGAAGMSHLGGLLRGLRWWTLRPDARRALLVRGAGEGAAEAVAAVSTDRSFAVVYMPTPRTVSLDLSRLRGRAVEARWFDPTSGRLRPASGSPFRPRARTLRSPARNGAGDGDFVLLLTALDR